MPDERCSPPIAMPTHVLKCSSNSAHDFTAQGQTDRSLCCLNGLMPCASYIKDLLMLLYVCLCCCFTNGRGVRDVNIQRVAWWNGAKYCILFLSCFYEDFLCLFVLKFVPQLPIIFLWCFLSENLQRYLINLFFFSFWIIPL